METSHSVDMPRTNTGQVGHSYMFFSPFLNKRHPGDKIIVQRKTKSYLVKESLVDLTDNLIMTGQQAFKESKRPFFQSLRKQGVIGIGKGLAGDVPGGFPG